MIRNGLYKTASKPFDGLEGGHTGLSALQDGKMSGGGSIYYHYGSYTCSNGEWKGELTVREYQPSQNTELFAGQIVTMGFSGTYTDDGAEITATALAGKRSVGLKVMFERLEQD
jgi:hypothetical protein